MNSLQHMAMEVLKTWFLHSCAVHTVKAFLCAISGQVCKSQLPHKVFLFCNFQWIQCLTQGILYWTSVIKSLKVNHYGFTLLHALVRKELFKAHKDVHFSAYWGNLHTEENILNHKKTPSRFSSSWRKASYGCNEIQATNAELLHSLNTAAQGFQSS